MGTKSYHSWAAEFGLTLSLAAVLYILAASDAGGFFSGLIRPGVNAVDVAFASMPERRFPTFMWPLAELGIATFAVLFTLLTTRKRSWFTLPFAAILMAAIVYGGTILAWRFAEVLFDPLTTIVMIGAMVAGCTVYRIFERQAHSKTLRSVLRHGVSQQMLQVLTNAGKPLESDGAEREVTVLFCNLRDIDALFKAYEKTPEAMVQILRMAINPLMNEIRTSGGIVERTSSTGLKAMWNAPAQIGDHQKRACDTAMALLDRLDDVNKALEQIAQEHELPYTPLSLGIGVNTGPASIGNIGSEQEPMYSALGSAVHLAQHLQDASETYGPAVIVGEQTYKAVEKAFAFMQVDRVSLAPNDEPDRAYALLGNPLTKASPKFKDILARHSALMEAYDAGHWETARQQIKACRELGTVHPQLYDLYEARVDYLRRNPPGDEWDGVFRQTAK